MFLNNFDRLLVLKYIFIVTFCFLMKIAFASEINKQKLKNIVSHILCMLLRINCMGRLTKLELISSLCTAAKT